MDIKIKYICIVIAIQLLIIFLTSCNQGNSIKTLISVNDSSLRQKHQWLKEYALCSCIKFAYKNDTSIKSDLSFGIYKQIADYNSLSVYKTIDSESEIASINIKPTQIADYGGKRPLLLGCIQYYQSKKLDSLIDSFDK